MTAEEHAYERRWWTLGVLCVSLLVIGLDNTILNVALPTLVGELHASGSQLQWIVDSYVLVFAGLLLTAGSLGDRFGRRRALMFGLAVFGVGSVLSAFAGSAAQLIATRALMGIGGAFIMPSTLSILTNVFPAQERARAIGIWAGVSGIGIAIGPVLGGWLLEHFWWGSVFIVNVPVVITGLIAGPLIVPESSDPAAPRLDPLGAVLSIAGLTALVYAIIEAPMDGWLAPTTVAWFLIAAVVLGLFFSWEARTDAPMLDVSLFRNPRFSAASASITLAFFALFGSTFFLSQYLQFVHRYTALQAGLRLIPVSVGLIIAAPRSAKLVARFGTTRVVTGGLTTVALAYLLMSGLGEHTAYWQLAAILLLLGLGMGNTMAPATESIMSSLPRAKAGVGSAVNDTTRQVGGALGVAILGSLLSSAYAGRVDAVAKVLPGPASGAVRDSIGKAIAVASELPGGRGGAVADGARSAFVGAMHVSVLAAAAVALAGAVVAFRYLPARGGDTHQVPETETDVETDTELALAGA